MPGSAVAAPDFGAPGLFTGGPSPSVWLTPEAVLALQQTAGNRAVSRMLAASRPILARDPPSAAPPTAFQIGEIGDDPAAVIADLPAVIQSLATIQLDADARAAHVPDTILHPVVVQVYTETHIATLLPTGAAVEVREQDVMHPIMCDFPAGGLREPSSGRFWFYGHRGGNVAIQALPNIVTPRVEGVDPGATVFVVYMPGITMPAPLVRRLRQQAGGGGDDGAWAQHAVDGAQQRVRGAGTSGDGPGAGRQGTGAGGGGTGTQAGDGRPLQGQPRLALVTGADPPRMQITVDRAKTSIALQEGETPAALDARISAAINTLQNSRDPAQHDELTGAATQTGFQPGQGGTVGTGADATTQASSTRGATTPSERVPGAPGGANATAYPAKVTMAAPEGDRAPTTTVGASNEFTMALDYAALSLGFQDEVYNRLQDVQFYWELIDVTALTSQQARDRARQTRVGAGQAEGPGSGAGNALSRDMSAIAEDQDADLRMMAEQNWPWEARAAYLGVIGLSNVVRTLGSLISSFVSVITEPLNARSIGFRGEGDYLVRCVATPQVNDEARADPDHHVIRASSTAVLPVRVQKLGTRAAQAVDGEATQLQALQAQLQAAEASHDQHRIDAARASLEGARRAATLGGFDLFTQSIDAARERVRVAELLSGHVSPPGCPRRSGARPSSSSRSRS